MLKNLRAILLIFIFLNTSNIYGQNNNFKKIETSINKYFEKAAIMPNKHILSILPSVNQYPIIFQSPPVLFEKDHKRNLVGGIVNIVDAFYFNYEYTLNHNIFVEAGFKYLNYYTSYGTNDWLIQSGHRGTSTSAYSTYSFDFGGGYRVVMKNNLRLFDVHIGFSTAFTDNKVGTGEESYLNEPYQDGMGNIGTLEIYSNYTITKRFNLGFYIGLSKDIRVTDNLYLTARYNNSFGQNNTFSEHTFAYSLSTYGIVNEVKGNLTTKGQMYAIGLRWVFN
ncbi:hypothetical protein DNU06_17145 [Putridiphycobacter roseus]|uniref:Uncharacterized protein n=1 Tax=Putridiphycobacter roseus TaxID=2219161 RepID=A0A2W1NLM4_9FLAO|nr:hypothetical protein [Putridiphycobacter roseus]PZE15618.1 hypothetical protein DNU06_17145 [Putridiphycobacter roseus]